MLKNLKIWMVKTLNVDAFGQQSNKMSTNIMYVPRNIPI